MLANRGAVSTAENLFNAGRLTLSRTSQAAEVGLYDWLGSAKAVLAASFGLSWSTDWAAAGFVNNSTAIPANHDDRIGLAEDIVEFLTANPTYEVSSVDVTAACGTTIYEAAVAGQKAVTDAEQARDALELSRQAARATVLGGMRGLMKNLEAKLGPMDARWLAFGLDKPGARVTPAKPTGLTLTLLEDDSLQVSCDAMPLASRYRFRLRVVGPGNVFYLAASKVDPLAIIQPVPLGETVEIIVQAVNDNLQSVASDPVAIVIPPIAAQVAEVKAAAVPGGAELVTITATAPNGNGKANANGNGHGNGSRPALRAS